MVPSLLFTLGMLLGALPMCSDNAKLGMVSMTQQ
jgi:hypothetical protein